MTPSTRPQLLPISSGRRPFPNRAPLVALLAIAILGLPVAAWALSFIPYGTGSRSVTIGTTVTSTDPIPRMLAKSGRSSKTPYKTWSLFLVCNREWLSPEKSEDLFDLYEQFQSFGKAIGQDHLAVWFWKSKKHTHQGDRGIADNIDVVRSVNFCKSFHLKPSEGPHILIVSTYPDPTKGAANATGHKAVYALGSMEPKEITKLLDKLTDQLVMQGNVPAQPLQDKSAMQPPPQDRAARQPSSQDRLWIRLLEATRRALNGLDCALGAVTVEFSAGDAKPVIKPCQVPREARGCHFRSGMRAS